MSRLLSKRFLLFYLSATLVTSGLIVSNIVFKRDKVEAQTQCSKCAPPSEQVIYTPLIDLEGASSTEINLNCRSAHPIDVVPTFYTVDGTAIEGNIIQLQASEIRFVDVQSLIPTEYKNQHSWGGMSLSYTGRRMEVWGQLTFHTTNGSVNTFFTAIEQPGSNTRNAIWHSSKNSKATIALGNYSDFTAPVTLTFSNGDVEQVNVAPHGTQIITRKNSSQNQRGINAQSVTISSLGQTGRLIPMGLVFSEDENFSSSIRFADATTIGQANLYSTNFRLKNTTPHIILKNTSDYAVTVTPRFLPLSGEGTGVVELKSLTIPANSIKEVNLKPLVDAAKTRKDLESVSVQIINSGGSGSLIGAANFTNDLTGVNYDIPLRDSGLKRNSAGGFPIRLDDDYTTNLSITNVSDTPSKFLIQINHESGHYALYPQEIAAGATALFDFRKIRDDQIPDSSGRTLPPNLTIGQIRWSIVGLPIARLIARSEIVSRSENVSSSYSCPVCCPDSFHNGWVGPGRVFILPEVAGGFEANEQLADCYNNVYDPYVIYNATWSSYDTNIATVDNAGLATGVAPGQTSISAFWTSSEWLLRDSGGGEQYCEEQTAYGSGNGMAAVRPQVTSISASILPTKNPVTNARPSTVAFTTTNTSTTFASGLSPSDTAIVFKSSDPTLTITANGVVPTTSASSLEWKFDRDTSDTGTGYPTLSTSAGSTLTVTPNTAGNFKLICWFDTNSNSTYDTGEEIKILRLVVVQTSINVATCKFDPPSVSNPSTFVGHQHSIDTTSVTNEAMTLTCEVTLKSGGSDGRVGLDKVTLGVVGNLTQDNFTIDFPVPRRRPLPPGNQVGTEIEVPNGNSSNQSEWYPYPMVDTSNVAIGNEPTGGSTPFRFTSVDSMRTALSGGGEKRTVIASDGPQFGWDQTHPFTNNIWATTTGGNYFRESVVGYADLGTTNSFKKTYVCLAKGDYKILAVGSNNSTIWQQDTGATINVDNAVSSLITNDSPQSGDTAGVQVLGKSFVNEVKIIHTP
jgi:hypothetical protein